MQVIRICEDVVIKSHGSGEPGRAAATGNGAGAQPIEIESGDLFRGASEIVIRHAGERYRLRITKQNKLILNK